MRSLCDRKHKVHIRIVCGKENRKKFNPKLKLNVRQEFFGSNPPQIQNRITSGIKREENSEYNRKKNTKLNPYKRFRLNV